MGNADATIESCHLNKKKRPRRVTVAKKPRKIENETSDDIEDIQFSADEILKIRASLLKWYDENQRDLPWRRISKNGGNDTDGMDNENVEESERRAYAVWVSEVMLQQTRVQTVIDYFNKWMNKWPTLYHLAQASLEEVNEMWAGLGYYRRARFLLEGAKMIVEEGRGFPKGVSALRKVNGIGEYTAGAISSIAFREVVPVVDGNVVRVIARLKTISRNPKDTVTIKKIWKLAGQLVDDCRPGDFNQALMELGATVCTPLSPSCSACPIATQCCALSLSRDIESVLVTDYPIKVVKAKQRREFAAVSVVEILEGQDTKDLQSNTKFLLVRRADEGLLAGLWEFPSVPLEGEADLTIRRKATNEFLKSSFNLVPGKSCTIVLREEVGEYVHVFSHIRLKMYIELIVLQRKGLKTACKKELEDIKCKYVDRQTLSSMGLTSGVRKMVCKSRTSRPKIACFAVQESSAAVAAETKDKKEDKEEEKPAPPAKKAPAAKAPVKPLPQMMEEDVIPSLLAILEAQQDIAEIELSFQDNKLEGSFLKKGYPYSFWAFFPDGVLTGARGFSLSSYGSGVSTVEPFLIDEKRITAKLVIFWIEKRLAAQGIIPVWQE